MEQPRRESDDWHRYQHMVLNQLEMLLISHAQLGTEITALRVSLAELKTRNSVIATFAGLIAGGIPALAIAAYHVLSIQ